MDQQQQLIIRKQQFEQNAMDIQRLIADNEHLENEFNMSMSMSYEMTWNILKTYLNRFLKGNAFVRSVKQVTVDDCKIHLRRHNIELKEVVVWELVLPEETGIMTYWPILDVTNKHYLLQQHYDLGFVRYLAEKKFIQPYFLLTG